MTLPKIIFAGDRQISVDVLRFLTEKKVEISALLLPEKGNGSHDDLILSECSDIEAKNIFRGDSFKKEENIRHLSAMSPDYLLSVHFHHIFPKRVLEIPKYDPINLHPAYLPYNRGWHTPSWAIWEQTPYGATLHIMAEGVDSGKIIDQKRVNTRPEDTANSLYQRVLRAEFELFKEVWPSLADFSYNTKSQSEKNATVHSESDLEDIRPINLDEPILPKDLIRKLRALTTNDISEAAYFEQGGNRYRIQIEIVPKSSRK